MTTYPSKVQAISDWLVPKFVKELRGFLGLVGYCRKFIVYFGIIAKPQTELRKDSLLLWTFIHESAFAALKTVLCSTLVLALSNFSVPFHIEIDALGVGMGVVLPIW